MKFFMHRIMLIISILLLAVPCLQAQQTEGEVDKAIAETVKILTTKYYRPLTTQEIMQGITQGFQQVLDDPYIQYYPPKEFALLKQEMSAKYQGIGAMIKYEERQEEITTKPYDIEAIRAGKIKPEDIQRTLVKQLKVISPLAGSPSEKAGLKAGDIIVAIDGDENLAQYTLPEVIQRLRGPQGSKVVLKIHRPATQENLPIEIVREEFHLPGFSYKMLPENIGYLHCKFFHKNFAGELRKALDIFQQEHVKGIILDMRGCNGGLLDETIEIANLFLGPGTVLQQQGRDKTVERTIDKPAYFDKAMMVLMDKETCSGAELLAGALKDSGRAILIGQKTYGKGSIQEIFELTGGGALKITVAHYLTPKGKVVDKKGIPPDLEVATEKDQIAMASSLIEIIAARIK